MPRKYKNYTNEDIIKYSVEVFSMSALLKKLNLKPTGGNYDSMRRKLQELNVDTKHWTGQAWNKDKQTKDWFSYTRSSGIKPHLIKERGHKCEECNLTHWLNKPITLELEHIDGDRTNPSKSNLKLLCPNCHSYTPTWRRKKSSF